MTTFSAGVRGKENTAAMVSSGADMTSAGLTSQQMSGPMDELRVVQESLAQIEAILKAESKRRQEANQITEEYILNYLDSLEQNLNQRVSGQFQNLEKRITMVDTVLHKVEQQFDAQDREVN